MFEVPSIYEQSKWVRTAESRFGVRIILCVLEKKYPVVNMFESYGFPVESFQYWYKDDEKPSMCMYSWIKISTNLLNSRFEF